MTNIIFILLCYVSFEAFVQRVCVHGLHEFDMLSVFMNPMASSTTVKLSINRKWHEERECVVIAMVCCIILLHAGLTASRLLFPKGNTLSMQVVETHVKG